nr:probable carbohydrate esterase At4g34215 [Ipomoea batatas]
MRLDSHTSTVSSRSRQRDAVTQQLGGEVRRSPSTVSSRGRQRDAATGRKPLGYICASYRTRNQPNHPQRWIPFENLMSKGHPRPYATHFALIYVNVWSIFRFNSEFRWEVAKEPLHVDKDKGKVCGVGPKMPFAHEVLKRNPSLGVIGLVPCAIGGTYITEWLPDTTNYNQTLKRPFAALQEGGKLQALLWYQGENEAKYDFGSFAMNVPKFFKYIRKDLNILHFLIVQDALSLDAVGVFTKEVRNLQLQFKLLSMKTVDAMASKLERDEEPYMSIETGLRLKYLGWQYPQQLEVIVKFQLELKLPLLSIVDANGSHLQGDQVLLTFTAQAHLGLTMANAFLKMSHR